MPTVLSIALSLFGLYLVQILLGLRKVSRNAGNLPCQFLLVSPISVLNALIPRIFRSIPYISAFPQPRYLLLLADAAAIKDVTTSRSKYPKPLKRYEALAAFGANIVASDGAEWKKYRKVTAPAFSERNFKLVWHESVQIMVDLFDQVWGDKSEIVVDHCLDITLPMALFVIGTAGFGRRVTWTSDHVVPPGHQMTFKDALHIFSANISMKLILPSWAENATKHTRKVTLAFLELKQYMLEMVEARRDVDKAEQRYDLLSGLLDATQDAPDNGAILIHIPQFAFLEVVLLAGVGNMYIFLFAGHETTGHTLCFSFALLALHPDVQERLYEHIKGVLSSLNRTPTYEDMGRFTYSLAPPKRTISYGHKAPLIPKIAAEDMTLTVSNAKGGKTTFPVPSGTQVDLHVAGLHHNPQYWKDPNTFMPERFLGDWPKDAFAPFSLGARACLGRRFFETQGIAAMAMMVSRYKIEIKEEPEFSGETFEERYARITAFDQVLTTTPLRVPLVFKRR
ncbi:cytochrome P450 [Russula dissimulans]|nr:cytochrome P450 [Russula dissimulans]